MVQIKKTTTLLLLVSSLSTLTYFTLFLLRIDFFNSFHILLSFSALTLCLICLKLLENHSKIKIIISLATIVSYLSIYPIFNPETIRMYEFKIITPIILFIGLSLVFQLKKYSSTLLGKIGITSIAITILCLSVITLTDFKNGLLFYTTYITLIISTITFILRTRRTEKVSN